MWREYFWLTYYDGNILKFLRYFLFPQGTETIFHSVKAPVVFSTHETGVQVWLTPFNESRVCFTSLMNREYVLPIYDTDIIITRVVSNKETFA